MANQPLPIKGTTYTVVFPIFDNTGALVTGAASLDSEVSKDGGAFADCTAEAAEIGSSGMYSLSLTATEMNADIVTVIVKTSTTDAKTTPIVMYPYGSVSGTEAGDGSGLANTLADLRWLLRTRLNDLTSAETPGGNYATKALDAFINLAYRETVRKCKAYYTTLTVPVTDNVEEYDGTTLFEITHIVGTAADSQPLKRTTMRELLMIDQDYRTAAKGTAAYWYPTKGGYFGLYPKPIVATTLNYYVSGYAYPTALTSEAHTPDALPDGDAIQVILDRAECHARRARPTHANNVQLAAQLEQSWLGWCQEIRDSIRAEGN